MDLVVGLDLHDPDTTPYWVPSIHHLCVVLCCVVLPLDFATN